MTVKETTDLQAHRAEQVRAYFQGRKPDCEVSIRCDFDFWRFYFVRDDKNAYIFDISRHVVADWSGEQIVSMLESAGWEHILEANPGRVPHFTNTGLDFHPRPA